MMMMMAAGRVSCSSYENQIKQLQVTFSHTLLKYEGYIEYNDNKVKWSGGLAKLKSFVVDLFGDEGKNGARLVGVRNYFKVIGLALLGTLIRNQFYFKANWELN
jgi:hypothetical protein